MFHVIRDFFLPLVVAATAELAIRYAVLRYNFAQAELARDLNHFLDRITQVVSDLDHILAEVLAVGERPGALQTMAPPVMVSEAQATEYKAFAQSLREMALLEATMQKVAESGQQVLQRLAAGQAGQGGPIQAHRA